jgi:hypothetical protein
MLSSDQDASVAEWRRQALAEPHTPPFGSAAIDLRNSTMPVMLTSLEVISQDGFWRAAAACLAKDTAIQVRPFGLPSSFEAIGTNSLEHS